MPAPLLPSTLWWAQQVMPSTLWWAQLVMPTALLLVLPLRHLQG